MDNKIRLFVSLLTLVAWQDVYRKLRDVELNYKILDDYLSVFKIFWFQDLSTRNIQLFQVKIGFGEVSNKPSNWLLKAKEDYKAFRAIGFGEDKYIAQYSCYRGANN